MQLEKWLKKNKLTVAQFADLIDARKATVYHWLSGHQVPGRILTKRVIESTNGEVTEKDWK